MSVKEKHDRGVQLYAEGKYSAASTLLAEALSQEATSELANDYAAAELACGRPEKAEQGFLQALSLDANAIQARANLGTLLAGLGRAKEAIPHLKKATLEVDEAQRPLLIQLLYACLSRVAADALSESRFAFEEITAHAKA
jgi:Flp pilus assembly protein TadD